MNALPSSPPAQSKHQWASTADSPIGAGQRASHRIPRTAGVIGSESGDTLTPRFAQIAHNLQAEQTAQGLLPSSGDKDIRSTHR